jgi:ABC-type branched-subunit amino acid transport system substrate-binding protein
MSKSALRQGLKLVCALTVVFISLYCVGCGPKEAEGPKPVKIAVFAQESGFGAQYGLNIFTGADLAIEEINAQGGILGGRPVQGIHYDEGYSAEVTINSLKEAVSDGCTVITGFTDATQATPAADWCKDKGLPFIDAFAGAEPTICKPDYYDAAFVVNMANIPRCFGSYHQWINDQGYRRLSSVLYTSEFGLNNQAAWKEFSPSLDLKRVYEDWYAWGEVGDCRAQLPGAVAANPDFMHLQIFTGVQLYPALERLVELGYTGPVGMDNCALADGVVAAEAPEGLIEQFDGIYSHTRMSATPDVPSTVEWSKKFLAYCKEHDINILKENDQAVGGYTAVWLAALAIDKAGTEDFPAHTDEFVRAMHELDWEHPAGFKVSFTEGGEMKFPHNFIQQIVDGKVVVIDTIQVAPWD